MKYYGLDVFTLILFLFLSIEITYANPFIDLSTPMGRDVNNVITCGEGSGAIVLGSALFLSNNPAKFIEDIDGNLSFDSDVVKVGLFLVDTFSTDGDVFIYTDCNTESAYDRELNDAINQTIISNIQTLQPVEFSLLTRCFPRKPFAPVKSAFIMFLVKTFLCFQQRFLLQCCNHQSFQYPATYNHHNDIVFHHHYFSISSLNQGYQDILYFLESLQLYFF